MSSLTQLDFTKVSKLTWYLWWTEFTKLYCVRIDWFDVIKFIIFDRWNVFSIIWKYSYYWLWLILDRDSYYMSLESPSVNLRGMGRVDSVYSQYYEFSILELHLGLRYKLSSDVWCQWISDLLGSLEELEEQRKLADQQKLEDRHRKLYFKNKVFVLKYIWTWSSSIHR